MEEARAFVRRRGEEVLKKRGEKGCRIGERRVFCGEEGRNCLRSVPERRETRVRSKRKREPGRGDKGEIGRAHV